MSLDIEGELSLCGSPELDSADDCESVKDEDCERDAELPVGSSLEENSAPDEAGAEDDEMLDDCEKESVGNSLESKSELSVLDELNDIASEIRVCWLVELGLELGLELNVAADNEVAEETCSL